MGCGASTTKSPPRIMPPDRGVMPAPSAAPLTAKTFGSPPKPNAGADADADAAQARLEATLTRSGLSPTMAAEADMFVGSPRPRRRQKPSDTRGH
eukprot:Transcript_32307.p2 GENE.Transcript_32307~~Transcript_32307.p2  ORF type:complete len:95 (+),score=1.86 Transcript_32307:168-452(+)